MRLLLISILILVSTISYSQNELIAGGGTWLIRGNPNLITEIMVVEDDWAHNATDIDNADEWVYKDLDNNPATDNWVMKSTATTPIPTTQVFVVTDGTSSFTLSNTPDTSQDFKVEVNGLGENSYTITGVVVALNYTLLSKRQEITIKYSY